MYLLKPKALQFCKEKLEKWSNVIFERTVPIVLIQMITEVQTTGFRFVQQRQGASSNEQLCRQPGSRRRRFDHFRRCCQVSVNYFYFTRAIFVQRHFRLWKIFVFLPI